MMNADDEMDRLIAAYLDGTMSEEDRVVFEKSMRDNPVALQRAAQAVRFDTQLSDALRGDHLEIVQQRRMVIDRATGQPVIVETSDRVARPIDLGAPRAEQPAAKPWPGLVLLIAGVLAAGGIWWATRTPAVPASPPAAAPAGAAPSWVNLPLRNAGFEQPDLSTEPPSVPAPPDWQEKYVSRAVTQRALPAGEVHGGKQVAWLPPGSHMKQLLHDEGGKPVVFEPGRKLRISGWVKPESTVPSHDDVFHLALHYVDDQLRQYVVCYHVVPLDGSGWRRFSVELTVPAKEVFEPSYTNATNVLATVTGRPVLLSITNISFGDRSPVAFMLDDMQAELMEAPAR